MYNNQADLNLKIGSADFNEDEMTEVLGIEAHFFIPVPTLCNPG